MCLGANNHPDRFTTPECYNAQYQSPPGKNWATGPNSSEVDAGGIMADLTWNFGSELSLKSISAYRKIDGRSERDLDSTPIPIWDDYIDFDQQQFSQEFQLSGSALSRRLNWLVGAFYMREKGDSLDLVPTFFITLKSGGSVDNDTYAVFTQLNYDLNEKISLSLGARYMEETKRYTPDQEYVESGVALLPNVEAEIDTEEFNPSASIQYHLNDSVTAYLSYSQGVKGGGFTQRISSPIVPAPGQNPADVIPTFDPEEAKSYEIGVKSELFNRRVRLNAAIFQTDYTDKQINILPPNSFAPTVRNAGDVEFWGAELELEAIASDWLRLNGGVGYLDHEYTYVNPNATAIDRNSKLPNAPKYTANLGFTADLFSLQDLRFSLRADASYKSRMYKDAPNSQSLKQDGYTLLNLSLLMTSSDEAWFASAGVTNLTDEDYIISGIVSGGGGYASATMSRGAEWFLRVGYHFR
ncbi:MAG: TonB-dependent receptor [Parahaliea sp.]